MGHFFDSVRRRTSWSVPILALLGLLLLSLLAEGIAGRLRTRAERLDQAAHDATSLALLIDQHVSRLFDDIDDRLARIADRVDGKSWDQVEHSPEVRAFALRLTRPIPLLHAIALYDAAGHLRFSTERRPVAPGTVKFDLPNFLARMAHMPGSLVIGPPVRDPQGGPPLVSVGRVIIGAGGMPRGFVVGIAEPSAWRDFFRWAPIGAHGAIELLHRDGSIVVSTVPDDRLIGQRSVAAGLLPRALESPEGEVRRGDLFGDGIARVMAVHPMAQVPFVVVVELRQEDILKNWLRRFVWDSGIGAVVMIGFVIVSVLLHRRITGEQRATVAARLAEQRFNDALESTAEAFALWDADDRLVVCNSRYRELHAKARISIVPGVSAEAVIAASTAAGIYKIEGDPDAWLARRMERHNNPRGTFEQQHADGRWLLVSERRTSEGGTVGIRTDITALKGKERELEKARAHSEAQAAELSRLAEGYAAALREAAQANETKTLFLASMSHELRTPLNAIIGFSELMTRETFGPLGNAKYREYAADVNRSGQHLLELISDVLDLAKIEAGKMELLPEPQDIAELIDESMRLLSDRAAGKGVALSVELPPDLPFVHADRRAAKQILLNLFSNAVKYTNKGGSVCVTAELSACKVTIAVRDTGIGIAARDLERLFKPFERARNARRLEGTGLGLAIAQSLALRSGGDLWLESVVGEGTVAWLELPTVNEHEPVADAA
jgi:signal transduction histidine kinase